MEKIKKILIILAIINIYLSPIAYANKTLSFLTSAGYSEATIDNSIYTGYNASAKLLFSLTKNDRWQLGLGGKAESLTSNSKIDGYGTSTSTFNSIQGGLEVAYVLSSRFLDFQLNPFCDFVFFNDWVRQTTSNNGVNTRVSPVISKHYVAGIGSSLLFKIFRIYIGPSVFYSENYMEYNTPKDNYSHFYPNSAGTFQTLNINLSLGIFL